MFDEDVVREVASLIRPGTDTLDDHALAPRHEVKARPISKTIPSHP